MVGVAVAAPSSEVVWVDRSATSVQTLRALGLESREAESGVWMQFDAPPEALAALTVAQVPWSRHETGATRDKSGYTTPERWSVPFTASWWTTPASRVVSLGSSVEGRPCCGSAVRDGHPAVEWRILGLTTATSS